MPLSPVSTSGAPLPIGPYSQAVGTSCGLMALSGQTPIDPRTGELVEGDIEAQARQVFVNLRTVLQAVGISMDEVLKVNVFLTDMADFSAMNRVYEQYFEPPFPARTTIAVAGLPLDARIEVELWAENGPPLP